ncbi:hypothetical protein [Pseudomonas peradeniyensis]|nr:hypothetical protein [Pseudomonas peradeniyensis]
MKKNRLQRSLHDLRNWASDITPYHTHHLDHYLFNGGELGLACDALFRQGLKEVKRNLLLAMTENKIISSANLRSGTARMLISDAILIERLRNTNRSEISTLDGATHLMFCAAANGQHQLLEVFYNVVLNGLNNGYGLRDGHDRPIGTTLRYAAFGLAIIGDWLGKPLDFDKHVLPRDPAWGQLVAHWREPDPAKLLPILMAACDTHVERIALNSRELDSGKFEFGSPFEAVYAAEILAILNLRRSLGLSNPFIDHPLMTTPYAKLTSPPGTRLEKDELLERFMAAVCKYDPQAMPEGLYQAVMHTIEEP